MGFQSFTYKFDNSGKYEYEIPFAALTHVTEMPNDFIYLEYFTSPKSHADYGAAFKDLFNAQSLYCGASLFVTALAGGFIFPDAIAAKPSFNPELSCAILAFTLANAAGVARRYLKDNAPDPLRLSILPREAPEAFPYKNPIC